MSLAICKQCRTQLKAIGIAAKSPESLPHPSDDTTNLAMKPEEQAMPQMLTEPSTSKESCQYLGDTVEVFTAYKFNDWMLESNCNSLIKHVHL